MPAGYHLENRILKAVEKFKNRQNIKLVKGNFQNDVTPVSFDKITVSGYLDSSKSATEQEIHTY